MRGGGYPSVRRYLGRRARRLIPAFWLVITVTLLWFGSYGADTRDVLVVLAFAQVFSQGRRTSCSPRPGRSGSR
jgi:peptidoglycan/LPS O-acetylase OafA/YrhL